MTRFAARAAWLDDAAVLLPTALVFALTMAPGVTTGDSGDLITAAATGSLAHPTGYPLYLLLGRAFIALLGFLPADLAMNWFSALAGVATVIVVRRSLYVVTGHRWAAVGGALLLAFSLSFWSQATTARVYLLGALLTALVLHELLRLEMGRGGSLFRAWFWFGLAMANHTVALVLAPLVLASGWRHVPLRQQLVAPMLALPGLALYIYIPLVATSNPVQNWGNPTTWDALVAYFSRRAWWQQRFVHHVADVVPVIGHYLAQVPRELTWIGVASMMMGLLAAWRAPQRGWRWVACVGLYLFGANVALMALHGSRHDIFHWPRYLITGWMGLVMVGGLGVAALGGVAIGPGALPGASGSARRWLVPVAALAGPVLALVLFWPWNDRSEDRYARAYATRLLDRLEPGAVLFGQDDNILFPLSYLHHVERRRPDIELVMPGLNEVGPSFVKPDQRPTYFTHPYDPGLAELRLVPDGLALRLTLATASHVPAPAPWDSVAIPLFERLDEPGHLRYLDRMLAGNYFFMKALNLERADPVGALATTDRMESVAYDVAVVHFNAGILRERLLDFEGALASYEASLRIDPRNDVAVGKVAFWREVLEDARSLATPGERAVRIAARLFAVGRMDLSKALLEREVAAGRGSYDVHYALAALHIDGGDYSAARAALLAALALRPGDAVVERDLERVGRLLAAEPPRR